MILGALIDAGVSLEDVRAALGSLAIAPDAVWTEPVVRGGIRATKFNVRGETAPIDTHHEHDHDHETHRHEPGSHRHESGSHRTLAEIFRLIDCSSLSGAAKDRTKQLFTVLGEAEAAIHGTPLDSVHLHEVGALDSIIDIAGTVYALEQLGVDRIQSSSLNVGGGTIHSAHGRYPVPAPATMRLLKGIPVYSGAEQVELVTPTGALLISGYAHEFGPIPAMRVNRIGYGAGTRDFPRTPNVLRVLLGELDAAAPSQSVVVIEAEIDDMAGYTGERAVLYASVLEFIHTATLVHDDIIDESQLRRGREAVHTRWGNHVTVLFGDFLYLKSMSLALTQDDLAIIRLLCDVTLRIVEGEIYQLTKNGDANLTEAEHFEIVQSKTAYLFAGCARIGGMLVREIDVEMAARFNLPKDIQGVIVSRVDPMGPAYDADIERGNILLEINRQPVHSIDDFRRLTANARSGEVLALYLYKPEGTRRELRTVKID